MSRPRSLLFTLGTLSSLACFGCLASVSLAKRVPATYSHGKVVGKPMLILVPTTRLAIEAGPEPVLFSI